MPWPDTPPSTTAGPGLQRHPQQAEPWLAPAAWCAPGCQVLAPHTHPLARLPYPMESEALPKKRYGMGTSTYMRPVSSGHQFFHSTQPCRCTSSKPGG